MYIAGARAISRRETRSKYQECEYMGTQECVCVCTYNSWRREIYGACQRSKTREALRALMRYNAAFVDNEIVNHGDACKLSVIAREKCVTRHERAIISWRPWNSLRQDPWHFRRRDSPPAMCHRVDFESRFRSYDSSVCSAARKILMYPYVWILIILISNFLDVFIFALNSFILIFIFKCEYSDF